MATKTDTTTGTMSLTAGSVNFTTSGVNMITRGHLPGDTIMNNGFVLVIETIDGENVGTLRDACPAGAAGSGVPTRIRFQPDGSRVKAEARNLIDVLGNGTLQALAELDGIGGNRVVYMDGPGSLNTFEGTNVINIAALGDSGVIELLPGGGAQVVPKTDLISGVDYDVQVANLAARAAYDLRDAGFSVLVSNVGDGRSAIYSKNSNTNADWSAPAYITGPSITLQVSSVDEVPFGTPPDVNLVSIPGGYNLEFDIPRGMIIQPGTTTTLAPNQPAAVNFVPITGGFRLDMSIPRGMTGDINGVTSFWTSRLASDTSAAQARDGLNAQINVTNVRDFLMGAALPAGYQNLSLYANGSSTYSSRILRLSGPDGDLDIQQSGNGNININGGVSLLRSGYLVYHRNNIVGTVINNSPNGAIIETGSNANGNYTRFVDGTQICTNRIVRTGITLTAAGPLVEAQGWSWSFPASFASPPRVSGAGTLVTHRYAWPSFTEPTTSSVSFTTLAASSPGTPVNLAVDLHAIGRWF